MIPQRRPNIVRSIHRAPALAATWTRSVMAQARAQLRPPLFASTHAMSRAPGMRCPLWGSKRSARAVGDAPSRIR